MILKLPDQYYKQMKAHALGCAPSECCGILATIGDMVVMEYGASNIADRPHVEYLMEPIIQKSILQRIAENGWNFGAIYHSHPYGPAQLSQKDIDCAYYPGVLQVIIGMSPGLTTKAYSIENGQVEQVELEIV